MDKKRIELSIIIPIGNFQKDKANLTLICNRLSQIDIEVIFILDSQPSDCKLELEGICRTNVLIDYKILTAHLGNPGDARNLGLNSYSRYWVTFWDSDDLPHPNPYLEETDLVRTCRALIVGAYVENNLKNGEYYRHPFGKTREHNLETFSFNPGIWRVIFSRDVIGLSRFSSNSMGEDQEFICKILSKEPEIYFSSEIFYEHVTGSSSSLTGRKSHMSDLANSVNSCFKILSHAKLFRKEILYICLRQIQTCFKYGESHAKIIAIKKFVECILILRWLEIRYIFRFIYLQLTQSNPR